MTNEFNRTNLRQIRQDLEEALKSVALAHGITIDTGNIRFSSDRFTVKIEARTANRPIESITSNPVLSGGVVIGAKFRVQGTTYTLDGFKPNRPKYPYTGVGPQGGRYKFTREQVEKGLVA